MNKDVHPVRYLIGLDDTDNLESRGTGHFARELGLLLALEGIALPVCISRHQLFVHPDIPFTSHNSSACIVADLICNTETLIDACIKYVLNNSASGSDAGLCIVPEDRVSDAVIEWGYRAKKEVLTKEGAIALAGRNDIFLEGLTGERIGVIGSLAACGLRKSGNDGRVLWMNSLRDIKGILSAEEIQSLTGIQIVSEKDGKEVPATALIDTGEWMRPIIQKNKIILFVEPVNEPNHEYRIVSKELIKSITE